jgi:hypothetical protein
MRLCCFAITLLVLSVTLPATAAAGLIDLRIRFQADTDTKAQLLTLRCADRATGTVPHPADACRRLRRLGNEAFRPTPPNTGCTMIFGGPSTARVTGIYLGHPIWVRLRRDNGCEIARWQRVGFLLPQSAAPS